MGILPEVPKYARGLSNIVGGYLLGLGPGITGLIVITLIIILIGVWLWQSQGLKLIFWIILIIIAIFFVGLFTPYGESLNGLNETLINATNGVL